MDTADWYREQKMGLAIQTFRRPKCEDFWKVIKSKCLIAWQIRASVIVPVPPPPPALPALSATPHLSLVILNYYRLSRLFLQFKEMFPLPDPFW